MTDVSIMTCMLHEMCPDYYKPNGALLVMIFGSTIKMIIYDYHKSECMSLTVFHVSCNFFYWLFTRPVCIHVGILICAIDICMTVMCLSEKTVYSQRSLFNFGYVQYIDL